VKRAKAPKQSVPPIVRRHATLLATAIVLAWLAYSNSFRAPLILDNAEVIEKDARVHSTSPVQLHRILTQQYWETANTGLYRPLTTLSILFNYVILGDGADPGGYHGLNFLLHAANIALVYVLGVVIFESPPLAFLLSALWALHPVQTESVTNIVGRSDELVALGVLAALLCHRLALATTGARRAAWIAAVFVAVSIGVFSKESGVVVIAVFAIYDLAFRQKAPWSARAASYAAAAIPCLVYLYIRSQVIANATVQGTPACENPLLTAPFWTARLTAVKVIGRYFGLWLWPAKLSWDYAFNEVPLATGGDWLAIVSLLGCLALAVIAVRAWRNQPTLLFAIGFFFVALAPTANLVILIGATMGERFLYLPSLGFAIAAVWAIRAHRQRKAVQAGLGLILLAMLVRTHDRNGDWLDPQRFWLSGVEAAPGSYKTNLAAAANTFIGTADDLARSIRYADRALAILDPMSDDQSDASAYHNAGVFYRNVGQRLKSESESWNRKSLAALLHSERVSLAFEKQYQAENARRGRPNLTAMPSGLYLDLGRTYLLLSDRPHAIAAFERGRSLESSPPLLEELASVYRSAGEPRKAAQALVEALSVDANRPQTASALVELYAQIDPQGCSVTRQGGVPELNPTCPLVHADVCSASRNVIGNYLRRGQEFEAGQIRKVAEGDLGCDPALLR